MYDTDKTMMNLRLNWAENMLLSHEMARSKTQIAVTALIEPSPGGDLDTTFIRDLTYDQLYLEVEKAASALRKLGVTSGDRVAALSPNNAGEFAQTSNGFLHHLQEPDSHSFDRGCRYGPCYELHRCHLELIAT